MYCEHFGLEELPFRITPDTRFFYSGGNRGAVLGGMVYAITRGEGIIKVVGEVGSGKTMLCRMLELGLPSSVEVVYLANPHLRPEDVPQAIAAEMGLPIAAGADRLQVLRILQESLLAKHAAGRQVVLFIEEAQGMPLETLEEIRLLSNLETQHSKLLQIVLFGQPELEQRLAAPEIRQLRERITQSFELERFGARDVREYIDFRLRAVGYRGQAVLSPFAIWQVVRSSRGLIRRINILADKALLAAYTAGVQRVTVQHVEAAVRDSDFSKNHRHWGFALASAVTALALIVTALVAGGLMQAPSVQSHRQAADIYWMRLDDTLALVAVDASRSKYDAVAEAPAHAIDGRTEIQGDSPDEVSLLRDGSPRFEGLGD